MEEGVSATLERPFTKEEVKTAVWDCNGSKTRGPDGYTLEFFKIFWELVKEDVMKFISDFHSNQSLIKACTSSFISLIPKVSNPKSRS